MSPPHGEHALELAAAKYPAEHSTLPPDPSHAEPAGHSTQVVRVIVVPPSVYEPAGQTEHVAAELSL